MAFFGLTGLGYQRPIGDRMIVNPREEPLTLGGEGYLRHPSTLRCTDVCSPYNQPPPHSADMHRGSVQRYRQMVAQRQTPQSPNQLYLTPVTTNQVYGWMTRPEAWTRIPRFPRKNSEMTEFVNRMSTTHREFRLF